MTNTHLRTCVTPDGSFCWGIHKPTYSVTNMRESDHINSLGQFSDGSNHINHNNFPKGNVQVNAADWIYEIANPFPFRGATYITKSWAESKVHNPAAIKIPTLKEVSFCSYLDGLDNNTSSKEELFANLPHPVLLALAANSTDPADLEILARLSCEILFNKDQSQPVGLRYKKDKQGRARALFTDHALFEIVVNNIHLPDSYKEVMVLRPGVQGDSEIIGDNTASDGHIFEYLRRNSYIPWGHYAANMANDSIRYQIADLSLQDLHGLRHLYYQRTYIRLSELLGLPLDTTRTKINEQDLESLRKSIVEKLNDAKEERLPFHATIWGWNYGFDCASNGYRLHASHQMIHQQFAMIPNTAEQCHGDATKHMFSPFGCGELVSDFIKSYFQATGSQFFEDYIAAINNNKRVDGRTDYTANLIIYEDNQVLLFVPKAQTSQWELQLMTKSQVGNIVEADIATRQSLNNAMLIAMQSLTGMGAKMISTIEYPKPFQGGDVNQRLLYSFLPKLPESPGAFSEAQLRFINGHYPEDFARACRRTMKNYELRITNSNNPIL